jgi:hypothetical protein
MANAKISELPIADALTGEELIAVVQDATTKQSTINDIVNYLVPTNITVSTGIDVDLNDTAYDDAMMIKLTWDGGAGNMSIYLPLAVNNANRLIRIISNGGFAANTRADLTPSGGDTLDGAAAPSHYEISKDYVGLTVWSDGNQWYIIQAKA